MPEIVSIRVVLPEVLAPIRASISPGLDIDRDVPKRLKGAVEYINIADLEQWFLDIIPVTEIQYGV